MNTTTITITLQYQSVTTPKCEDNSTNTPTTSKIKSIFQRLFTRTPHPHQTHSQLTTLSITLPQHEANKLITNLNKLLQP